MVKMAGENWKISILSLSLGLFLVGVVVVAEDATTVPTTTPSTEPPPTTTKYTLPPDRPDLSDPCSRNDHLTDPLFTCCAKKKYPVVGIYTVGPSDDCYNLNSERILESAWKVFKCLIDKKLNGKELNFQNLGEILMEPFDENIKNGIKSHLKNFQAEEYAPYKDVEGLGDYKTLATAWNAYYTAENWACSDAGSKKQRIEMDEEGRHCYTWIDQSTRRGDCCSQFPIPFQLYPDPMVDRYYTLRNFTAYHLMNISGPGFDWENSTIVSFSDNLSACLRTAMLIQQKKLDLESFKKSIESQDEPDYGKIADYYIPKFISKEVRDAIKLYAANETALSLDHEILRIVNNQTSIYRTIYVEEWKVGSYDQNATKFLFWNCRAHKMVNARYKNYDIEDMCV